MKNIEDRVICCNLPCVLLLKTKTTHAAWIHEISDRIEVAIKLHSCPTEYCISLMAYQLQALQPAMEPEYSSE